MQVDELLAQVLRLPRHERARVAEELLSSIEEPNEEAAAAWVAELEKRSEEIARGSARVISWETAHAEI
jgi:putative addiction module component (TIGR02574 family)